MINPENLLVGDIVNIDMGLILPCDGVLLHSNEVLSNEAAMTGESDNIEKASIADCEEEYEDFMRKHKHFDYKTATGDHHHTIPSPIVMSGTTVETGTGTIIVIAVGKNSAEGRILELSTQDDDDETPLQKKLNKIAMDISKVGLTAAIFALVILFLRFIIEISAGVYDWDTSVHLNEFVDYFVIAITVLVVAIPEGLPLAVTISLAYSVKKMQK